MDRHQFDKKNDCSICRKHTLHHVVETHPRRDILISGLKQGLNNGYVFSSCGHRFHELCVFLNMRDMQLRKVDDIANAPIATPSESSGIAVEVHNRIIAEYKKPVKSFECDFGCGKFVSLSKEDMERMNTALWSVKFFLSEIRRSIYIHNRPYVCEALDLGIFFN